MTQQYKAPLAATSSTQGERLNMFNLKIVPLISRDKSRVDKVNLKLVLLCKFSLQNGVLFTAVLKLFMIHARKKGIIHGSSAGNTYVY